ncbi:hypothetical protein, partial [Streptomyces montanisoli]|uniref:hypothetical protein n=1 Tax=Streptomyces montanisoli TaxID=2798581 RepID=UPI001FD78155
MSSSSTIDPGAAAGEETGARFARSRAVAVLRVRGRALGVALLPAAVAVVLLAAGATGRLTGSGWNIARWAVIALAVAVLLLAAAVAAVVSRARPALSPTVAVAEKSAPGLYRLVRDLAERMGVPPPSAIALTPDCDSWLEDRTHPAHAARDVPATDASEGRRGAPVAPVLVIGSPFLWWMRVAELRAVLAPVVAGTGPSAHPDIAAARRLVRGLDAAVAVAGRSDFGPLRRWLLAPIGRIARLLLRGCGEHAALMERGVATAASERAQAVDYGLRIVAQEQVGLAYAGWDRLLTRVALPAWRMGRWPDRLDAGVVSALTELSRRDRLAEGFASRLGERPACDLLEEPGAMDEAASLLAARLFHGGPAEAGADWSPVDWQHYPEEVVDRKWRTEAARLHRVLDDLGVRQPSGGPVDPVGPTLDRVLDHLSRRAPRARGGAHGDGHGHRSPSGPAAERVGGQSQGGQSQGGQSPGGQSPGGQAQGGQAQGGQARGVQPPSTPHPGGPEVPAEALPDALFGDPSDDALPVVPRGLEEHEERGTGIPVADAPAPGRAPRRTTVRDSAADTLAAGLSAELAREVAAAAA